MSTVVVIGTQWGDEGKGKITDFLAETADVVVRYQGGNNAGHTIVFGGTKYKLHLVPSGIFYPDKICVLGNGMVIDIRHLLNEIEYLNKLGVSTDNLKISDRAHLVMPYHITLDKAIENSKEDNIKIGTTKKGIGPAYMDKVARTGLRVVDLLDKEQLFVKLRRSVKEKNDLLASVYDGKEHIIFEDLYEECLQCAEQIRPYVVDISVLLNEAIDSGSKVLFEGAQGAMLDIDHGTYPFVTSSSPISGGVCIGTGVGPTKIKKIVGVAKAYTTRVGDGPFPTELFDATGDQIREVGKEYGTTTGRPRRIGWFDSVVVRHACRVSGITGISLNSLDVLSGLRVVKICTAYNYKGTRLENYPADLSMLAYCDPIYEEFEGWQEDITGVQSLENLPDAVQVYISRLSELIGVPILMFSVGPDRTQTVHLGE